MWPKTLVLVDDNEFILRAFCRLLQGRDYVLETFGGPEAALEALERIQPDVLLTDYHMPRMDGLELLERVQRQSPSIGRVLLTGWIDWKVEIALQSSVVQVVVQKPWKLRLILQGLEALRLGALPTRLEWQEN